MIGVALDAGQPRKVRVFSALPNASIAVCIHRPRTVPLRRPIHSIQYRDTVEIPIGPS